MWIATEHGYFSAVADRSNPEDHEIWVRARAAKDLIKVRNLGYDIGQIIGMTNADYPYRAKVRRTVWAAYVAAQVAQLDYTNFKDRIHEVDDARADIYMGVWHEMTRIENDDWKRAGVAKLNEAEAARASGVTVNSVGA